MNLNELTIKEAHEKLSSKEISSFELVNSCVQRIEATEDKLHCFLAKDFDNVLKQANKIRNNARSSQRKFIRRISESVTPQFLLIHTLSHLLIKELEYDCGYPVASLQERLYIGEKMFGFMIKAIEGTEGSLGGLVSQCDDLDNLNRIIKSALQRAKDCSSDPICENSDGQGVENLNLAACYSCTLLPDISCEMFNSFLDRGLLIDKNFGFFKKEIS